MKLASKLILLGVLLAGLLWPQVALAQGPSGDKYVFGGTYTLSSGQTLNGNLYVFGGIATIEDGATVDGNAMLMGGTLKLNGRVTGDVVATGGLVDLGNTAVVDGDVNTAAAHLNQALGAEIHGSINNSAGGPFQFNFPGGGVPNIGVNFNPLWDGLWFLFRSFLWAALAILVVLFLPRQTNQVAQAAVAQPLISGGLGLLTVVIVPLLLIVVAITIIGIPVSLLGLLALVIVWGFGIVALGTEVGKRMAEMFKQEWALAVKAGVGTFILVVVADGLARLIPCIGWTIPALLGIVGVGAVLLTRFGTQPYPPAALALPASGSWPPAPPVAPPAPTAPQPPREEPYTPEVPTIPPEGPSS